MPRKAPTKEAPTKKIWITKVLKDVVGKLKDISFQKVTDDFKAACNNDAAKEEMERIRNAFGQAVYQLVATNDKDWKRSANKYTRLKRSVVSLVLYNTYIC